MGVTQHYEPWERLSSPLATQARSSSLFPNMQASPLPPTCLHSTPQLWPFQQSLSQSIYNSVTPSAQQLPQPRAGNAIRGSACPAGSAPQLSGWSGQLPIFLFVLSDPSAVSRVTILHLSSCIYNLQYMCVSSWRFIALLLSNFDDTAVAAFKVVGKSRRTCALFLSFFKVSVQVDKSDSWYATKPSLSYSETGGWTSSPPVSILKNSPENSTPHLLVSGLLTATCIIRTETLYYKSLLENLGRTESHTCTATTLKTTGTHPCDFWAAILLQTTAFH